MVRINRRQVFNYTIIANIIIIVLSLKLNQKSIFLCAITYLVILLTFNFAGKLKRFGLSTIMIRILFNLPFLLPLIFRSLKDYTCEINVKSTIMGAILGGFLILINITSFVNLLSKKNPMLLINLSKKYFYYDIFVILIGIICEEIYFRLYIISEFNIYGIIISAILFSYTHYMNEDSKEIFNYKNYFQLFVFGILCSILYYYTNNVYTCIMAHLIFDLPYMIVKYRRTKMRLEEVTFDDYL